MGDRLPFHVLTNIFSAVRASDPSPDTLRDLVFVSTAWADAASFVMYRSVALYGGATATLFVRTLQRCPHRAYLVRTLLIALELDDDAAAGQPATDEEGLQLVNALAACPNVIDLSIRPLPPSVRIPLLAALASKQLESLVCAPRLNTPQSALFRAADLVSLASPGLQHLELDIWTFPLESREAALLSFPSPLDLTHVKLACSGAEPLVLPLLAATNRLEEADVYLEYMCEDPAALASALMPSAATLRHLTFLANPPLETFPGRQPPFPPAVNRILPSFEQLEFLSISATEVSVEALRLLPSTLKHLEIESITNFPYFDFSDTLLHIISTTHFTLQTLVVQDQSWSSEEAGEVRTACAARGISFIWH